MSSPARSGTKGGRPTLSVCLITRNEAERLPLALDSVAGVADEVVLADTGSTDDTVSVARARGALVLEVPWRDDFSNARNSALDAATGDWVLNLDADETLARNQDARLRALLTRPADAYYVEIRSPLSGPQAGQVFLHRFPRLIRNRPGYRYVGRVHEQVLPSLEAEGARVAVSGLRIDHSGYVLRHAEQKEKLQRNLELLRLDLRDRPHDAFVCYHLGETYALLNQPARAWRSYQAALRLGTLPLEHEASAHQNLAGVLLGLEEFEQAIAEATRALEQNPTSPVPYLILGSAYCRSSRPEEGVRMIDLYLKKARKASESGAPVSMGFEADPARAFRIRGEAYFRMQRFPEAKADAERAVRENPGWAGGHRLLGRVAAAMGDLDAAERSLGLALERDPGHVATVAEMALLQGRAGRPDLGLEILDRRIAENPQALLFACQGRLRIQTGDLRGAITSFERRLDLEPGDPEALRLLAGLYHKMGDREQALEHLVRFQSAGRASGPAGEALSSPSTAEGRHGT